MVESYKLRVIFERIDGNLDITTVMIPAGEVRRLYEYILSEWGRRDDVDEIVFQMAVDGDGKLVATRRSLNVYVESEMGKAA